MALNSGPNKRMNGPDGRVRNTQTSNARKNSAAPGVPRGGGPLPSVPGFGASFGSVPGAAGSLASAWAALQNQMAASAAQRKGLKAAFKSERASIRGEAIGAMSDAINAGIESGMTGSSSVSQAQIGVIADRRQAIEQAKTGMKQGIIESKAADQGAYQNFFIQKAQMEQQAEAARQAAALQAQAIAAQRESTAALLAGLNAEPGGTLQLAEGVRILGRTVTTTDKGNFRVAGMTFAPGTPMAQVEAAIRARDAQTRSNAINAAGQLGAGPLR